MLAGRAGGGCPLQAGSLDGWRDTQAPPTTGSVLSPGALPGHTHWVPLSKAGRTGEGAVTVWRGLGGWGKASVAVKN